MLSRKCKQALLPRFDTNSIYNDKEIILTNTNSVSSEWNQLFLVFISCVFVALHHPQHVAGHFVCVCKFIFKCVGAHYYSPCAAPAICLITFQSPLYVRDTHTHTHSFLHCAHNGFPLCDTAVTSLLSLASYSSSHLFTHFSLSQFLSISLFEF